MHKQMYAVIPNGSKSHLCEIFGYSTRGIPGLEIVGLGAKGKAIKEKFIYFNKCYEIKIPPKRFVLCVDDQFVISNKENLHRWLELPFLIMYWSMAGVLPIQNLANCLCSGIISTNGAIETLPIKIFECSNIMEMMNNGHCLITNSVTESIDNIIPVDEIIRLPKRA